MRPFRRAVQKKLIGQIFKIGGNNAQRLCLLHETHFKRIYAKQIMQNTKKMVKLSQTILVPSYCFADIMIRYQNQIKSNQVHLNTTFLKRYLNQAGVNYLK